MNAQDALVFGAAPRTRERARAEARAITMPWHRLTLGAILLLATLLNGWQLDRLGYSNTYYAAAVRSMMLNWHNFFFNSFDPGGFVTIDKPPLGFWFQVASAKLFGYNGVSLLLPAALAGVLSVWVLYGLVARQFGRSAGLIAALVLAVTPVAVAASRSNIIDSILVLFLLLAAWALLRALETGKLHWLLLSATLVGLGFNVKMLEAFLVVPAMGLAYLIGAPRSWRVRIGHLALATVVLLTVSLSWAVAVDLTPASQRPWVDSTTTNSELDLALGYNGLERLLGRTNGGGTPRVAISSGTQNTGQPGTVSTTQGSVALAATGARSGATGTAQGASTLATTAAVSGASGSTQGASTLQTGASPAGAGSTLSAAALAARARSGAGGAGGAFDSGAAGPLRLIGSSLGGQDGWLLPLALVGMAAALSRRRVRLPLSREQTEVVLWGAWLLTTAAFFSVAGFFHSYYLVTMAPAVAALCGIGLVTLWQGYRRGGRLFWMLPAALVATAAAQAYILHDYPDWSRWLTPLVVGFGPAAAVSLALAHVRPRSVLRRWAPLAAALGMASLLLAPTVWAADTAINGTGGMSPAAGPSASNGFGGRTFSPGKAFEGSKTGAAARPGSTGATQPRSGRTAGGFGGTFAGNAQNTGGFGSGGQVNAALLSYLEKNQGTTTYLVAMQNSTSAAPIIIQTGKAVMSLGGFGGSDPILTLDQLKALIKSNTVRYFYDIGGASGGAGIGQWVQSACTLIPASSYSSAGAPTTPASGEGRSGGQALYDCKGAAS